MSRKVKDAEHPTIMVVEDSTETRQMLRQFLETNGYQVVEAAGGEKAMEMARTNCPDLVLVDLHLTVSGDLSATRLMRQIAEMCLVPVLTVSVGSDHHRTAILERNETGTAPINFDQLKILIDSLLPVRR